MNGTVWRRLVPLAFVPLALLACGLASAPWLRAYPPSVLAVPLFGAAVLSVLLPFVVINIGVRRLWQTALIDLAGYLFFVTLVALRRPLGYPELWSGLVHGPSQILSFALPLVSPRSLLVVPVTLCWLCGALIGECIGRAWQSVLPYVGMLVTFGLAYAATERSVTNPADGRRLDTILAGALLLCLLLLRAVQAWVDQDSSAESVGLEGVLPLRSVAIGALTAVLVAVIAAAAVQSNVFTGRAAAPARTPPIAASEPLSPLSFVAGLRPANPTARGTPLFTMTVDSAASRYVSIGDVDAYNGDSWSFARTFRPSGGVIPPDADPTLRAPGRPVTQQYTIKSAALTGVPWMPFEFRPQRVIGTSVDIDPTSGMMVPSSPLRVGARYSVVSDVARTTFAQLRPRAVPGTSAPAIDLQLPVSVTTSLGPVITAFQHETGVAPSAPIAYLQALVADLRAHYGLVGAPRPRSPSASSASPPSSSSRHAPRPSQQPTPVVSPSGTQAAGARPGGTSFAAVLASILGSSRAATPEQYATLVALIARQLNVPARVVTGFRLPAHAADATIAPGTYTVTTGDAWTWVEIPISGRGWVVLDPSPSQGSAHQATHSAGPTRSPRPSASSAPATLVTLAPSSAGNAPGHKGVLRSSNPVDVSQIIALALITLAVVIVLVLAYLAVRKWVRLRRRRRGDPRHRVVGAWQETLDVLVESGLRDPSALTSAEVAAATTAAFGTQPGEQARYLGDSANVAIFSPGASIGAQDADAAWTAHLALRRAVHHRLPWPQRLAARLRYHRPARRPTVPGPTSWASAGRPPPVRTRTARPPRRRTH